MGRGFLFLSLVVGLLSACAGQSSLQGVCDEYTEHFLREVSQAQATLGEGRALASASRPDQARPDQAWPDQAWPDQAWKDEWTRWAEARVKQVERYIDVTADEPRLHRTTQYFTETANELVVLQGFAAQGSRASMQRVLRRIESSAQKQAQMVNRGLCQAQGT